MVNLLYLHSVKPLSLGNSVPSQPPHSLVDAALLCILACRLSLDEVSRAAGVVSDTAGAAEVEDVPGFDRIQQLGMLDVDIGDRAGGSVRIRA